jgi:hypothetical protein
MYSYIAYGLIIHSTFFLPELVTTGKSEADVIIKRGKLEWHPPKISSTGSCFDLAAGEAYLYWDSVGTFLVRGGSEIIVDPFSEAVETLIRLPLLGMVLSTLLFQRGLLVLHGSAVSLNGNTISFLGNKGWGKSTMAASLCWRGHSLVSDDAVALKMDDATSKPEMLPAFPRLKLWPDAAASLGHNLDALPRISSQLEKRDIKVDGRFSQEPPPLKSIYVLRTSSSAKIELLQPQDAIVELIRNLHAARFGNQLHQSRDNSHFFQCAMLAKKIPIYSLSRPRSLGLLPAIAQLVEEHVSEE